MKKLGVLFLMLAMAVSVGGCEQRIGGGDEATETNVGNYNEEFKLGEYTSDSGFRVSYNEEAFEHDTENGADKFTYIYKDDEKVKSPIYITIKLLKDTDAQTVAEDLVAQSGRDDVEVLETFFGGSNTLTKGVTYNKEGKKGIEQIFSYHTVDTDKGTLLIEAVGYVDQPDFANFFMEEFFGRFFIE